MKYRILIATVISSIFYISCGPALNQPVDFTNARIGETTAATVKLKKLPEPADKVVVGVYNFRDLTGQYKASEVGSTFSTAVTQGATAILINALDDSGWFTTIERENIGNLLNERNIIRSTRQEYQGANTNEPQVPPLLYAGILLEGGIVSYDTNIITGGAGLRYFGVGGSSRYRQDRVTVYLRAISTSNGKILKNIYISKTILSQAVDANLYKFVKFQRILEAEVGFTRNEPVQLAVKEAIEKAVEGLVIEGIEDKLWQTKEGDSLLPEIVKNYKAEKKEAELTGLHNRKYVERTYNSLLGVGLGGALISGDYNDPEFGPSLRLSYSTRLNNNFLLNLTGNAFELSNGSRFSRKLAGIDINAEYLLLPNDNLSPFVYGGGGFIFGLNNNDEPESDEKSFFKAQYGLGLEYLLTEKIGIRAFAEHNLSFSDQLDYRVNGKRDDHYFNFGVGINFNLGTLKESISTQNNN